VTWVIFYWIQGSQDVWVFCLEALDSKSPIRLLSFQSNFEGW
jgi:hypothetical protein